MSMLFWDNTGNYWGPDLSAIFRNQWLWNLSFLNLFLWLMDLFPQKFIFHQRPHRLRPIVHIDPRLSSMKFSFKKYQESREGFPSFNDPSMNRSRRSHLRFFSSYIFLDIFVDVENGWWINCVNSFLKGWSLITLSSWCIWSGNSDTNGVVANVFDLYRDLTFVKSLL